MAHEDDHISDVGSTFDFKGFVLKVISYWKLILLSVGISLAVAYYNNVRKLPVYNLGNSISIKDDQNPFFTSNTSLTFNWGGTSDKVNTAMTILRSRSHNEEVVEELQFYTQYLKEGEYQRIDAYGSTPFTVVADTAKAQAINVTMTITFIDSLTYNLKANVPASLSLQNYKTKEKTYREVEPKEFSKNYKSGEQVRLPFFNGTILRVDQPLQAGTPFYVSFMNFDSAVGKYRNVNVSPESQGSSVLKMSQTG